MAIPDTIEEEDEEGSEATCADSDSDSGMSSGSSTVAEESHSSLSGAAENQGGEQGLALDALLNAEENQAGEAAGDDSMSDPEVKKRLCVLKYCKSTVHGSSCAALFEVTPQSIFPF